jgi:hypothetical protein
MVRRKKVWHEMHWMKIFLNGRLLLKKKKKQFNKNVLRN